LFINWQAVHRCTPDAILLVGEYAPIPPIVDFSSTSYGAVALDDLIIWARPLFHALKTAFLLYIFYILYLWAYFNKPIELSTLIQIFYFKIQNL